MNSRRYHYTRSRSFLSNEDETQSTIFSHWLYYWDDLRRKRNGDTQYLVDGNIFVLHSKLLSFWSTRFEQFVPNFENIVHIPSIKRSEFEIIVHFIYTTLLNVNSQNVGDILRAANYLEIDSILEGCKDYIIQNACEIDDIFYIYNFLETQSQSRLFLQIKTKILKNFWKIYLTKKEKVNELPINIIIKLVKKLLVSTRNLNDVVEVCLNWVIYDFNNRVIYVPDLIHCIYERPVDNNQNITRENIRNVFSQAMCLSFKNDFIRFVGCLDLIAKNTFQDETTSFSRKVTYFRSWQKRMKALRYNSGKADLTVKLKTKQYSLESWILSVSSMFFQKTPPSSCIELDLVENEFETVLNYMYGKNLLITLDNIEGILKTCHYLEIYSSNALIFNFLPGNLHCLNNVFKLFNISLRRSDEINCLLKNHVLKRFGFIRERENICELSKESMKIILSSSISRLTRLKKFELCTEWIYGDFQNRLEYARELLNEMNCSLEEMNQFHANLNRIYIENNVEDQTEAYGIPFVIRLPEIENFGRSFVIRLPELTD